MAGQEHGNPFEASHLIAHVKDSEYFVVPRLVSNAITGSGDGKLHVPQPLDGLGSIQVRTGFEPLDKLIEPLDFRLTRFMVLEFLAAVVLVLLFSWVAGRMRSGERPRGRCWNLLEAMLLFIRDEVARPSIGKPDADRFLPFLWTIFFFILACNLLGLVPWAGSPTGALAVTAALALINFGVVVGAGMAKLGPVGFWVAQVPHMDLSPALAIFLKPMVFVIEVLGLCIKHFVLAVRLLANMMAGHLVLAVIVTFISASAASIAWFGIMPASLLGALALNLLELFVAFLQAFIFTFLSALFIGMAVHPH